MHLMIGFACILLASNFGLSVAKLICAAENEHFSETASSCPLTCTNPHGPFCFSFRRGEFCVCNDGTVNDTVNHRCVAPENCPKTSAAVEKSDELVCGANEAYAESRSACPTTCQNRHVLLHCMAIIMEPSCVCTSGTIRDTLSGNCVVPDACPASPQANSF